MEQLKKKARNLTKDKHLLQKTLRIVMQHYSAVLQQRLLAVMQLYYPADFKDLGSCCILDLTADNCCWNSVNVKFGAKLTFFYCKHYISLNVNH